MSRVCPQLQSLSPFSLSQLDYVIATLTFWKLSAPQALMPAQASCPLVGDGPLLSILLPTEPQPVPLLLPGRPSSSSRPPHPTLAPPALDPVLSALSPVQTPASEGRASRQEDGLPGREGWRFSLGCLTSW